MFGGSEGFATLTVHHVGDRITQPGDQTAGAGQFSSGLPFGGATGDELTVLDLELDPYTIINLSAGVDTGDWSITAYVHNLGDENADLSFDRERGGRARLGFRTNAPRTIGVTFRKNFSN
jgi:outer membrane receptor protein involved in Fe transport